MIEMIMSDIHIRTKNKDIDIQSDISTVTHEWLLYAYMYMLLLNVYFV